MRKLGGRGCKHKIGTSAKKANLKSQAYKKRYLLHYSILHPTISAEIVSVSTEFDIIAQKHVHTSTIETIETLYKPMALMDETDLEFLMPAVNDT